MSPFETLFHQLTSDARYQANLDWGRPRRGHPEGTVRAHILELTTNLNLFRPELSAESYWKLNVLVHVHDTFKRNAARGVPITDPQSHASLARQYLAEFSDDVDMLNMVQFHDEPYALWRQHRGRGYCNRVRLGNLVATISDWRLFLRFTAIDGVTRGKDPAPLYWASRHIGGRVGLEHEAMNDVDRLVEHLRGQPTGQGVLHN